MQNYYTQIEYDHSHEIWNTQKLPNITGSEHTHILGHPEKETVQYKYTKNFQLQLADLRQQPFGHIHWYKLIEKNNV